MTKTLFYRTDLDILKGIAIIAVVLYHIGIAPGGYLGVDVFLVINGFLIVPKVVSTIKDGTFKYFAFLEKRIARLFPLMLLMTSLVLIVGYLGMLPDDYENLCESVVATNFFSGNILGSITAKNYWDVWNDFKPLMHTWYIGILFEFYLIFPLVILFVKWLSKKISFSFPKYVIYFIIFFTVISIVMYLCPSATVGDRFYLLPYRFFELSIGGLVGIWISNRQNCALTYNAVLSYVSFITIIMLLFAGSFYFGGKYTDYNLVDGAGFIGEPLIPKLYLLIITVIMSCLFVMSNNSNSIIISILDKSKFLGLLGMMSYSIFVWHQPLLAFYRYFYSTNINTKFVLLFAVLVLLLSYLTYRFIEKKLILNKITIIVSVALFILTNGIAFYIYMHAGVVRDVPELGIKRGYEYRNMFAKYNDRIRQFDKPFENKQDKLNVLCIGNSFARDWCNILLESDVADKINLSYTSEMDGNIVGRIKDCDYIFIFGWKNRVPNDLWNNLDSKTEVWGIGTKNFGVNNGQIYIKRNQPDYFKQTVKINPNFFKINDKLKDQWEDKYVDLLQYSLASDSSVIVFSDNHQFISQDCRHLTQAGAQYFANKIDFRKIFHQL